jgi:hypothetical protein
LCAYESRSSLAEHFPAEGALLELGDVAETGRRLRAALESPDARDAIVRHIRLVGSRLTWGRTADAYVTPGDGAPALSLVLGPEIVVGARSQVVSSETERRVLLFVPAKLSWRR